MERYYMGEDGKFRKEQQELPDGKYEMNADGSFSLQEKPQGTQTGSVAGVQPNTPTLTPSGAGTAKNDFAAKAARHTLPVSPVTQQVAAKQQQAAAEIRQKNDAFTGSSDQTRAMQAVVDALQVKLDSIPQQKVELTPQQQEAVIRSRGLYNPQPAKTKEQEELEGQIQYLKNKIDSIKAANIMKTDMDTLESWPEEDKALMDTALAHTESGITDLVGLKARFALDKKYGQQTVTRILESAKRNQNAKNAQDAAEAGQAGGDNLLNTIFSIPAGWASSVMAAPWQILGSVTGTGRYPNADPYTAGTELGVWAENVQAATAENAKQHAEYTMAANGFSEQAQNVAGELAAGFYQVGVGIADNLARVAALGGVGSLALSGVSSFSSTYRQAAENGASGAQAMAMGVVSGFLEIATEKIPLDNLLDGIAKAGSQSWGSIVKQALLQGGIEATTEEVNYLGNVMAQAVLLRESSDYYTVIRNAMDNGKSYAEAVQLADRQIIMQAGKTAAMAFFQGTGASAVGSVGSKLMPGNLLQQQAQERQKEEAAESQTVGNDVQQGTQESAPKSYVSMEEYANNKSPLWRNVEYTDDQTKNTITQQTHEQMVNSGAVVTVTEDVLENVDQSLPDLRGMKKSERTPILKDAVKKLKENLRQFLSGFSGQGFEFEVNGKVLEAKLYSTGINEVLEKVTKQKANMLYSTEDIFRNARYLYSTQDYDGDPNVYRWNYFYTPVQIGDETVGVRIAVRDMAKQGESQIYNWNIKKDASLGGVRGDSKNRKPYGASSDASNNSIRENVPVVNTESGAEAAQSAPITIDELTEGIVPDRRKETVNSGAETAEAVGTQAPQQGQNERRVPAADESVSVAQSGEYGENTVGGAESGFKHEVRRSKLYENTYANATDEAVRQVGETALENDPSVAEYDYISEEESLHNAKLRTRTAEERSAEYNYLIEKDGWTGEDNDTAYELLKALQKKGDTVRFDALAKKQKEMNTQGGQLTQSNAKYSRSATKAAIDAFEELDKLRPDQVEKRYYEKKDAAGRGTMGKDVYYQTDTGKLANGMDNMEQKDVSVGKRAMNEDKFKAWKTSVSATILDVANAIENTEDGDVEGMREIIRSLARFRHTTAWFGTQSRLTGIAEKALQTLDYDMAKDIAMAQLKQIPNDFKKRSVGQVVKTIRIHNMLGALTTVNRNLSGNASIGILDAITDSTVGRALDVLVAKYTGKRTVGNDIRYSKAYFNGAKKAAQMAALATELDIPIGAESRFSTGATRTFSPQGMGPVSKYLSAFDKAMRYALEVSDRFFAGGAESAVEASLKALGEKSNLSDAQMQELAQKTGQRRTFKDDRKLTRVAKYLKDALNDKGSDDLGAGDLIMPFAATGTNVAQTAVDYSSGGINGLIDIFRLMHDVKTGKFDEKTGTKTVGKREVSLVAAQRQAVTNAARGLTGIGLIAAFAALSAAGCLKVHEDEDYDKNAMEDTQNTSGAQLNISSALRGFSGKTTKWQDGDVLGGMDFLEPFNAQMYIGYELSKEENIVEMLKAYPKATLSGIWNSILDMPMMQSLSDLVDIFESEDATDAAGQFAGNMASGFIPATVRQAAQYIDPYYRDTSGNGVWEKALNQTKSYIPGLSQTLPKKYSGLGEEQPRYDNWLGGFFSTFVEPGDTAQLKINETVQYLGALSERTGKAEFYPDRAAPADFSYKDDDGNEHYVDLSGAEETEKYQLTYGTNIGKLYGELITMDDFTSADDETQVKILNSAKRYAVQLAKAAVSDYDEIPAYIRDRENGMSVAEALIRQVVVETTEKYGELSIDKAAMLSEAIKELLDKPRETKPDGTSYTSVRTVQKVEAVAGSSLTEKEQQTAMEDILDDEAYEKYLKILDAGYDNDDYAESYRIVLDAEKTKTKSKKETAIRELMQEMGLTKRQATTLYEIYEPKK